MHDSDSFGGDTLADVSDDIQAADALLDAALVAMGDPATHDEGLALYQAARRALHRAGRTTRRLRLVEDVDAELAALRAVAAEEAAPAEPPAPSAPPTPEPDTPAVMPLVLANMDAALLMCYPPQSSGPLRLSAPCKDGPFAGWHVAGLGDDERLWVAGAGDTGKALARVLSKDATLVLPIAADPLGFYELVGRVGRWRFLSDVPPMQ